MNAVRLQRDGARAGAPEFSAARIGARLEEGRYLLDDGRLACQALSCLIAPLPGDQVLVFAGEETFILALLARTQLGEALLSVPRARTLAIRQARVEVSATEHAALRSLGGLELGAAGTLTLAARNFFATVAESLVENVRHYVGRFGHCLMEAKELMRLHSRQATLTAEKEIRIDAERIGMG
jgi:hypothetical protein